MRSFSSSVDLCLSSRVISRPDWPIAVIRAEKKDPADANVVIRAHRDTAAGDVQEVIRVAQEQELVNFALRVKEDRS